MDEIDKLIEAGEKATRGEWSMGACFATQIFCGNRSIASTYGHSSNDPNDNWYLQNNRNAKFIEAAANARDAIKALKAERDRYKEALELLLNSPENDDGTPWINGGMSTVQEICAKALQDAGKGE